MKKIDGLKIDYTTGDADISLPPEFRGQTPEFKVVSLGYWIASLENERDKAAEVVSASSKEFLQSLHATSSIEDMVNDGEMIVFISKPHALTNKKFATTFQLSPTRKHLTAWESLGYSTYTKLSDAQVDGNSLKGFRRRSKQAFDTWSAIQDSLLSIGNGRIDKDAARSTQTPKNLACQIFLH